MPPPADSDGWLLTLYVSGASPRSASAIATLRALCATDLAGDVDLRIVDVHDMPASAIADQVVAVPTLVKSRPAPVRRLVGDLGDIDRLREGLGLPLVLPEQRDGRGMPSP